MGSVKNPPILLLLQFFRPLAPDLIRQRPTELVPKERGTDILEVSTRFQPNYIDSTISLLLFQTLFTMFNVQAVHEATTQQKHHNGNSLGMAEKIAQLRVKLANPANQQLLLNTLLDRAEKRSLQVKQTRCSA